VQIAGFGDNRIKPKLISIMKPNVNKAVFNIRYGMNNVLMDSGAWSVLRGLDLTLIIRKHIIQSLCPYGYGND
jgi:hypothetical protein